MHTCQDCGLVHDHVTPPTNAEVEIARIQAENALALAKIQAGADKHVAEVQADADVASARAEAKAIEVAYSDNEADEHVVEAINAAAVGLDTGADEPEPMPMPMVVNDLENDDVTVPPKREEHEPSEESAPRKKGFGMW